VLANSDFLRISKSVIVNLSKIKSLSPALSGRFEAALDNGEKVIISRQYVGDLKKRLGI
jgi:DNA-binding LytR/AlgR family response regulator